MKKEKPEASNPEKLTTRVDPPYLKRFGAVPTNDKVGQTFVISVKKPLPKTKDS